MIVRGPQGMQSVSSSSELLTLLQRFEAEAGNPVLVELERLDTGFLLVGLGGREGVLQFTPLSLDPPYLVSVGEPAADGDRVFWLDGEPTPIASRNLVPMALVRAASVEFCDTGSLLPTVTWEEV